MLRKIVLSILSGILSGLAFTAAPRANLIFLAIVPLLYVLAREENKKRVALYGLIAGLSHAFFSVAWIRHVAFIALPALAIYVSLFWTVFALFANWAFEKKFYFLLIPIAWVLLEWIKLSFGFFGWNLFAYALANRVHLIQTADLWGPWGISFLVVWVNIIIYDLIFSNRKNALKQLSCLLIIILASYIYGFWRIKSVKSDLLSSKTIKTEIIQPNASRDDKMSYSGQQKLSKNLAQLLNDTESDSLVITAEASWPPITLRKDFEDISEFLYPFSRNILLGVVEEREDGSFNNSMLFYNKQAKLIDRYAKIKLVPFGEFVPLRRFLTFIDALNMLGDMQAGTIRTLFDYKGNSFAALICFEDIFTNLTAEFVRNGAQFLVNATDDSWFYGNPQVYQHVLVARFRAIENKRSLLRAANSGISCLIDPWGQIEQVIEDEGKFINFSATKVVLVKPYNKLTVYTKYPNLFVIIFFLMFVLLLIYNRKVVYGITNS